MHAGNRREPVENFKIKDIGKAIKKGGGKAVGGIKDAGKTVGGGIKDAGKTVGGGIKDAGKTVGGGLKKGLGVFGSIGGFFKNIGGFFKRMWAFLGNLKWIISCCCCCCCMVVVYMVSAPLRMMLSPIMGALGSLSARDPTTTPMNVTVAGGPSMPSSYLTRGIAGAVGRST
jgi:hypothetical protein